MRNKDLLARWRMNLKFRPLRQEQKIAAQDKLTEQLGTPTSVQARAKQFLTFTLNKIGAFKRAGVKDERD